MIAGQGCLNTTIFPLGDSALVARVGRNLDRCEVLRVASVADRIRRQYLEGILDVVPAFQDVAIYLSSPLPRLERLLEELARLIQAADTSARDKPERTIEIPVSYGGDDGCDLEEVAHSAGISASDVVALHTSGDYVVQAIGFSPGFAYLAGLAPALCMARRKSPRARITAGSVAIGGTQTGIYSLPTPGGWNIIGRTPLHLFDIRRDPPALLRVGDRVQFRAAHIEADDSSGPPDHRRLYIPRSEQDGMQCINVVRPGLWTTIQDLGRPGYRADGIPLGGAADPFALRVANLLTGNAESAAALEFTLLGPELQFQCDALVALTGATVKGLPSWQAFRVKCGQILRLDSLASGCRGYLAVSGGIQVPAVLGSRSTYTDAEIGGLEGRPLRVGDVLPLQPSRSDCRGNWRISRSVIPSYSTSPVVRVMAAGHFDEFSTAWLQDSFEVSSRSNRMGVRLIGALATKSGGSLGSIPSSPVVPGIIQVPPDGNPIVLLADAQTIGGYPQIGAVISADIPLVAQLRPGDSIRFKRVTVEEARQLLFERERDLGFLRIGLEEKRHAN